MTQEESSNSKAGASSSSWWSALANSAASAMAVAKRDLSEIVDTIKRDTSAALLDPAVGEPCGAGADVGCSGVAAAGTASHDACVASESAIAVPMTGERMAPKSDTAAALLRARLQKLQEEESDEALGWGDEPDGESDTLVPSTQALASSEATVPAASATRGDTSAEAVESAHVLPPRTAPITDEASTAVVAAESVSDTGPSDTSEQRNDDNNADAAHPST
jgi:hypothetical protein